MLPLYYIYCGLHSRLCMKERIRVHIVRQPVGLAADMSRRPHVLVVDDNTVCQKVRVSALLSLFVT